MDYEIHGTTSRMYRQVPKVLTPEEILIYQDGLRETIPQKISELLAVMDWLEDERETKLQAIKNCKQRGEVDDFGVYFWTLYTEIEFSEYYIAQKWLRYWLDIVSHIAPEEVSYYSEMKQKGFSENDIERAKQYPIENLYEGNLRARGTQLVGICPFHKEDSPSFVIFTNDNHFHCFGCQAHGDVIEYLMKTKEIDFSEAVKSVL